MDGNGIHFGEYSVSNLCGVIFQSKKGQLVLLSSLVDIIHESEDEMKALNLKFMTDLINGNEGMLSDEAEAMLQENELDISEET